MKRRVIFGPDALADLDELYSYIATSASPTTAAGYLDRLEGHCHGFATFSERGTKRDDIRTGLQTTHFEGRLMIVFMVDTTQVTILRLLYGGRDLARAMEG